MKEKAMSHSPQTEKLGRMFSQVNSTQRFWAYLTDTGYLKNSKAALQVKKEKKKIQTNLTSFFSSGRRWTWRPTLLSPTCLMRHTAVAEVLLIFSSCCFSQDPRVSHHSQEYPEPPAAAALLPQGAVSSHASTPGSSGNEDPFPEPFGRLKWQRLVKRIVP